MIMQSINEVNNVQSSTYLSRYKPIVLEKTNELIKPYLGVDTSITQDITFKLLDNAELGNRIYQNLSGVKFRSIKEMDDAIKKEYFSSQLKMHLGNIAETARIAGVSREHLQRKTKEYGINVDQFRISAYADKKFDSNVFNETYVKNVIQTELSQLEDKINPDLYSRIKQDFEKISTQLSESLNSIINPQEIYNKKLDEVFNEVKSKLLSSIYEKASFNSEKIASYLNTSVSTVQRMLKKYNLGLDYGEKEEKKQQSSLEAEIKKQLKEKEIEAIKEKKKKTEVIDIREFLRNMKQIKEKTKETSRDNSKNMESKDIENKRQIIEAISRAA